MELQNLATSLEDLKGERRKIAAECEIPYHVVRYFSESGKISDPVHAKRIKAWVSTYRRQEKARIRAVRSIDSV